MGTALATRVGMHRILALVAALSVPARAQPVTVTASVGVRAQRLHAMSMTTNGNFEMEPGHDDMTPSVALALGYRLPSDGRVGVSIGVRAALASMSWSERAYEAYDYDWADVTHRYPLDLALTTELSMGRFWAMPSLGLQRTWVTVVSFMPRVGEPIPSSGGAQRWRPGELDLAGGLTLGCELVRTRAGSVGLVLDAAATIRYAAIGLGVAYHL